MELLAPAGTIAALKAAIKGGANAVYLGLGEHNARLKSNDFTTNNLREWVGYAHLFGVKVYVTLNTAVKDDEIRRVISIAECAAKSGADALIVSDLGVASILSSICNVPLHLSTQAGIQNSLDALALKQLRIKRVILSRETPLDDIPEIKKQVKEVEIFAQGALCVSFSGGCMLGSKMYDASGNRGVCNQGCRLTYTAFDESGKMLNKGKLLSPYDLSLGEKVRSLAELGVDSLKIEGRLKRAQYVYNATRYYRDLLDGKDAMEAYRDLLESFNRGFTQGYTLKKSDKIINIETSSHIGVPVGKVERVIERKGFKFALVRSEYDFVKGDGAKVLRKGVEVGGSDVTSVRRIGELQEIPVSSAVLPRDVVCLTTNARKANAAERIENTLPMDLVVAGAVGKKLILKARCGEASVLMESDSLLQASKSEDNVALIQKLTKVGGTDFSIRSVSDETEGCVYLNPSELADLKRKTLSSLREKIVKSATPAYSFADTADLSVNEDKGNNIKHVCEVESLSREGEYPFADAFVLCPKDMASEGLRNSVRFALSRPCYLRLPKITREKEIGYLRKILIETPALGVYADNLYAVMLARELNRPYVAGFGLNVFNKNTVAFFEDADLVGGSIEIDGVGNMAFVAGKVRLMNFAHCPFSVVYGTECGRCDRSRDKMYYEGDGRRYLILRRQAASCDFTMFEDKVTYYAPAPMGISEFYSLIGLNPTEKRDMMDYISEECGE